MPKPLQIEPKHYPILPVPTIPTVQPYKLNPNNPSN